jgi:tetratricopeptide (TPR) repeat protein
LDTLKRFYSFQLPWDCTYVCYASELEAENLKKTGLLNPLRSDLEFSDYEKISLLDEYIVKSPQDAEAWGELSDSYYNLNEYEKAIEIADEKLVDFTDNYTLHHTKILSLVKLEKHSEGLDAGLEALISFPNQINFWYLLSSCLTEVGRPAVALKAMKNCTEQYPTRSWYWFQYGYTFYKMERYDDAIEQYRKAIEVKEEEHPGATSVSWFNLACVCSLTNRIDESLEALEQSFIVDWEENYESSKTDEELENTRKDPRFEILINRYA